MAGAFDDAGGTKVHGCDAVCDLGINGFDKSALREKEGDWGSPLPKLIYRLNPMHVCH